MTIVTKKGDRGETSLYPAGRVSKDHPRMELVGALDELNAFLGVSKCLIKDAALHASIESVQQDLFLLGAEAVTPPAFLKKLKKKIASSHIRRLERCIGRLEKRRSGGSLCFSIPGKTLVSSSLDVSRTITRRAERRAVSLRRQGKISNPLFLVYLNRLSDFLYLLARSCDVKK